METLVRRSLILEHDTAFTMHRSRVGDQILRPMAALTAAAVGLTAALSAYAAGRAHDVDRARHLQGIIGTLSVATFPVTDRVLHQLREISSAELIITNAKGQRQAGTLVLTDAEWEAIQSRAPQLRRIDRLSALPLVRCAGEPHYAVSVPLDETGLSRRLYVLYRRGESSRDWWWAVGPPLLVGVCAIIAATLLATQLARSVTRRLEAVRNQIQQLADRRYLVQPLQAPHDEIHDLQTSMNELALRLQSLESEVMRTERLRLLAQLAAGLSHQQRNAIAGARLSVQLHQRECPHPDESLEIALQQLELTERSIRNILSLGQGKRMPSSPGDLADVLNTARRLVEPFCRHQGVTLNVGDLPRSGGPLVPDAEGLQGAVLNLLVNAVEAAGPHGAVSLSALRDEASAMIEVRDNGPGFPGDGPPGEPFVTNKPYGIGLGLAYARDVVSSLGGTLTCRREGDETCFRIELSA